MFRKTNRKAFTIVELVIVIAVIAILASVLVPVFGDVIRNAQDSKLMQEARTAYTRYLSDSNGVTPELLFFENENGVVAIQGGAVQDIVYDSVEEAMKGLLDDPETPSINEAECFAIRDTSIDGVSELQRIKVLITNSDLIKAQGGVNATSGELNTTFTNNWYADIQIPTGAKQVRFLYFQTGGNWGSAFMNGTTYLSGYCNKTAGGEWVTLDIPENATVFRYGYLYDQIAEENAYPIFEYLEFIGDGIQDDAHNQVQPSVVKHVFSVEVDIAPALGQDAPIMATDYGYIMLPESYTDDGEPTRLIIVCHGAGAVLSDYQSAAIKEHSQTYWLDMGYAIMDMYACPTELAGGEELHYGNPAVLECYEKGYAYVMKRFNLKQDGIFVLGSSMGGLSSFQIVQSGKFPVLAQVANCPVIDLFKQAYCNPWAPMTYQRTQISKYFAFAGEQPTVTGPRHIPSDAEIAYFMANFEKVIPYSPIFVNVISGDPTLIFNKLPDSATVADPEEATLYQQLVATHPCPLLIIHNTDDATVSYRYSEYLFGMLQRGDADVTLKLYNTGGHNAWDNGPIGDIENYDGETVRHSESRRLAIEFFRKHEP